MNEQHQEPIVEVSPLQELYTIHIHPFLQHWFIEQVVLVLLGAVVSLLYKNTIEPLINRIQYRVYYPYKDDQTLTVLMSEVMATYGCDRVLLLELQDIEDKVNHLTPTIFTKEITRLGVSKVGSYYNSLSLGKVIYSLNEEKSVAVECDGGNVSEIFYERLLRDGATSCVIYGIYLDHQLSGIVLLQYLSTSCDNVIEHVDPVRFKSYETVFSNIIRKQPGGTIKSFIKRIVLK